MAYIARIMSGTKIPRLSYDKHYVMSNERKHNVTLLLFKSTHELLNQFRTAHKFFNNDDALVDAMLEYNHRRTDIDSMQWPASAIIDDMPVAIASDPDRKMNPKKRKHGKSLDPDRRKVFEVGDSDLSWT